MAQQQSPASSRALAGQAGPTLSKAFNSQLLGHAKRLSTYSVTGMPEISPPRPEAKTFNQRADSTQLGGHHISKQMLTLLRPEVAGYASPQQYATEQRRQFMSLEPETHSLLSTNVKSKKEATKALRLFEVYSPDTVNKALKQ